MWHLMHCLGLTQEGKLFNLGRARFLLYIRSSITIIIIIMKNYCNLLLIVILSFLFLIDKTQAENSYTIIGIVSNEEGNPIEGASVFADQFDAITDSDGTFLFTDMPAGNYKLTASAHGYITTTEEIRIDGKVPLNMTVAITMVLAECQNTLEGEAASLTAPSNEITLSKNDSSKILITVTNDTGCPVEGIRCKRLLSSSNNRYIDVTPRSGKSDKNGQVRFTITAKEEKESAKVKFKTKGIEGKLTVIITVVK